MNEFKDCQYRFEENNKLYCKNKTGEDKTCLNCKDNVHLNCTNYSPKRDYCLKFFKEDISNLKECNEKSVFSDKNLSKKWSN